MDNWNHQQYNYGQQSNNEQPNQGYQAPNYGYQQPNYGYQQQYYGFPHPFPGRGPAAGIEPRSIATCIILSIVTCGFYFFYWIYSLQEDMRQLTHDPEAISGGMVIFLSIITCGIYQMYWMYKQGENIDRVKQAIGRYSANTGIIYLILSIFGLNIVSVSLLQDELNKMPR